MALTLLIEGLQQAKCITPLEKDILDTWDELQKDPFDHNSARMQIMKNNESYPEIFAIIAALPMTVVRPYSQATECDIRYNLKSQLTALAVKEGWPINGYQPEIDLI